jgi:pimeloyl-ACP methyl ester carboxylesterase
VVLATELVPGVVDCWNDNIKLVYNATTNRFVPNTAEISYRIPPSLKAVGALDPSLKGETAYMAPLIDVLASKHGFTKEVDLIATPYDFRTLPDDAAWLNRTRSRIEALGKPALLVAHSMGNLVAQRILQSAPSEAWIRKHIRGFVSAAGVFGGTPGVVRVVLAGDNEGLPVNPLSIRSEQRSYETNYLMQPNPAVFADRTIASFENPQDDYVAANLTLLYRRAGMTDESRFFSAHVDRWNRLNMADPGVPTSLVFGTGVSTVQGVSFAGDADFPRSPSVLRSTDGDGTVAGLSLRSPRDVVRWKSLQRVVELKGVTHRGVLSQPELVQVIMDMGKLR